MTQKTQTPKPRTLEPFLKAVEVADAIGHLNLTLVPLGGKRHGRIDYVLAQEFAEIACHRG